jgi:hypothetical protein
MAAHKKNQPLLVGLNSQQALKSHLKTVTLTLSEP